MFAGILTASAKAFVAPAAAAMKATKPAVTSSNVVPLRPGWKAAASSSGIADDKGKNTVPAASRPVLADDKDKQPVPAASSPGIADDKGKGIVPTASSVDERGKAAVPAASISSAIDHKDKSIATGAC